MLPTRIDLPLAARSKVVATLSPLLADGVDLYSQVKQAHWHVRGLHFISLHELFDKLAAEVEEGVDLIAERILQLGGEARGTVRVAAKASRLKEYPLEVRAGEEHLRALADALSTFLAKARPAIDATDKAGDAVTADLLTGVTRGLDKQLWLLEAHEDAPAASNAARRR